MTDKATVHGTKKGFDGLKEGSEVVARYSVKGTEKSADDIGKVGKDGMKVTKGTVTKFDEGTKTVVVKSADGTELTFEYTGGRWEGRRQRYGARGESYSLDPPNSSTFPLV